MVVRVQIVSPKKISLVGGLLVIWPGPIQAHDIYTDLLTGSGLCRCHDGDCRPVPYRLTSKGVQMFVDEQWLDIPGNSLQYRTLSGDRGETGGAHWCGLRDAMRYFTRCAILPPQSAATHYGAPPTQSLPRSSLFPPKQGSDQASTCWDRLTINLNLSWFGDNLGFGGSFDLSF
jgi:hypothetical protein